eukprot:CAMPEP_0119004014 /NCGR_PEP_ID=MMETSP1176-20130426/899_1 /TAXON_ID=265551 /ORGANISM="Synedropsis recta cf, Strain CCMP1620" /LENGTH=80 /DNA_ID=CAMNT_0006955671 /DNA_START=35 /DNA_END=277 /DNA_ORIENTATION=+
MSEEPNTVEPTPQATTWKLPDGIEDHLEAGVLKTAAGAVVGGLLGLALFRSGSGWRSASMAAGVGVGLGSTFQRTRPGMN